jgi:[protein-PII] uridylyltransferase
VCSEVLDDDDATDEQACSMLHQPLNPKSKPEVQMSDTTAVCGEGTHDLGGLPAQESSSGVTLHRERLYSRLLEHPVPGISPAEVDAHFQGMPTRYWQRVTKAELTWALETTHAFAARLAAAPLTKTVVVADSRYSPERGLSKIMVCAWDSPGLLAKIAAAFSALGISILRADVYTRADGLAIDVFEVCDLEQRHSSETERLDHFVFLLEGALAEPPRFASVWAGQFHKVVPRGPAIAPEVGFDNDAFPEHTVIRVQASDRLGLLHDLLRALAEAGLNISEATVETDQGIAHDVFFVTDLRRTKVLHPTRLQRIRRALIRSIL